MRKFRMRATRLAPATLCTRHRDAFRRSQKAKFCFEDKKNETDKLASLFPSKVLPSLSLSFSSSSSPPAATSCCFCSNLIVPGSGVGFVVVAINHASSATTAALHWHRQRMMMIFFSVAVETLLLALGYALLVVVVMAMTPERGKGEGDFQTLYVMLYVHTPDRLPKKGLLCTHIMLNI